MIDLDKIEEAAKRHSGDISWAGAAIAYATYVTPDAVVELIDRIRKQEAALAGVQARIGGLLLVQAGLVEALQEGAEYLEGVAKKTASNAVWARCDSIAGGMRKALAKVSA